MCVAPWLDELLEGTHGGNELFRTINNPSIRAKAMMQVWNPS
jgi:hypothetical protein